MIAFQLLNNDFAVGFGNRTNNELLIIHLAAVWADRNASILLQA